MSARISIVLVSFLAACGGDDGGGAADAAIDTPASTIMLVDPCPGTVDATITTLASRFDPATATITQGQVVKFVSTATHPIGAQPGTETTLAVPEGQTKCFRFTAARAYSYKCNVHGYVGTLTVN